jgi:polyisoprenoid-binding protein YceI
MRDRHLRSTDFFETERFPRIAFVSTDIAENDPLRSRFTVTGLLTIRNIVQAVSFDAFYTAPLRNADAPRVTIDASTVLDRRIFGMGWTSAYSKPANEVAIEVHLEAFPDQGEP